jgi:signal transduction histidine kinase
MLFLLWASTTQLRRLLADALLAQSRLKAANEQATVLSEASRALAASLDYRSTLDTVGHLILRNGLGDMCLVDEWRDGSLRRVLAIHRLPDKMKILEGTLGVCINNSNHPCVRAFTTGQAIQDLDIGPGYGARVATNPGHARLINAIAPRAIVTLPLMARGRPLGAMIVSFTESKRRHSQEEVQRLENLCQPIGAALDNASLYRDAQAAIQARDLFLSMASHELRTPLTSLELHFQVIRRRELAGALSPEEAIDRLHRIERQVGRMRSLVVDVLDVSRALEGRFGLQPEEVDMLAIVREVVERNQELLARSGSVLSIVGKGPCIGMWDGLRLDQIVANLLTNAIKFGEGRPIELRVSSDQAAAVLEVTDHGLGIPKEDQERIFGRFERAVPRAHYGGLGLGLWIVGRLVETMTGTIEVRSEPGAGSTFTVRLPRGTLGDAPTQISQAPVHS